MMSAGCFQDLMTFLTGSVISYQLDCWLFLYMVSEPLECFLVRGERCCKGVNFEVL